MKKQTILKVPPVKPRKSKKQLKQITAQCGYGYLMMDIWQQGQWEKRHVMDIETGEYATYYPDEQRWTAECLIVAELKEGYLYDYIDVKEYETTQKHSELIRAAAPEIPWYDYRFKSAGYLKGLLQREARYGENFRDNRKQAEERRLRNLMESVPDVPEDVCKWIDQKVIGDIQYAFYKKNSKSFHCTACVGDFMEPKNTKIKHKDSVKCPLCGHEVIAMRRGQHTKDWKYVTIIQNLDARRGVERNFKVEITWEERRIVRIEELIRLMMMRSGKRICKIYYADWHGEWIEKNHANRKWQTSYLYPDGQAIRDGMKDTEYEAWTEMFVLMAQTGIAVDYNALMVETNKYFIGMAEYLLKGRFYRLLREASESISYYFGYSAENALKTSGQTIEEVMGLKDKQRINRLRQEDGGHLMLAWLQWEETEGRRISTETLRWYAAAGISSNMYYRSKASAHMSPEQLMNYLIRQKKESYPKWKYRTILDELEDYLDMAKQLGKPIDDAMTYKPRELKRRHDEAVDECNRRRAELQKKANAEAAKREAERMREKYPGYEELLLEIKEKYEYSNETYMIIVPKDFGEIMAEGMALHHCVANTERYFDRIVSRETYICFLRRVEEPDKSFYTIEVEPGGTIRQHRGEYDEEPGIEEIKPFLRKWQGVIRKRMNQADHEYAKKSEELRQKNIEELKAKNNTRVLNGLMEDLMEVI